MTKILQFSGFFSALSSPQSFLRSLRLCIPLSLSLSLCLILQAPQAFAGHYESTSLEQQSKLQPSFVVPDYFPTQSVLISQSLEMGTSEDGPAYDELQDMHFALELLSGGVGVELIGRRDRQFYLDAIHAQTVWQQFKPKNVDLKRLKTIGVRVMDDWTRDWSPAFLKADLNGPITGVLDTNVSGMRIGADEFPALFERVGLQRVSLPFYHQGGNLVCNSKVCFASDLLLKANSRSSHLMTNQDDVAFTGNASSDKALLETHMQKRIRQKIVILPSLPYESTHHVDMIFQFIDENVIVMTQIQPEILNLETDADQKSRMLEVKSKLENIESILRSTLPDLKIIHVPQPLALGWNDTDRLNPTFAAFRSYANLLVVNSKTTKKIIFPSYLDKFSGTNDCAKLAKDGCMVKGYEESFTTNQDLKNLGFEVKFENAMGLIFKGGSIHCVTRQMPF